MIFDVESWIDHGTLISADSENVLISWGNRFWAEKGTKLETFPKFYFPDFFFKSAKSWFTHPYSLKISIPKLLHLLQEKQPEPIDDSREWSNPYYSTFCSTFSDLQKKIAEKEISKAVPYVFETCSQKMDRKRLIHSLIALLSYGKLYSAYLYGFWDNCEGILGATPEILFSLEGDELKTMACAGTISASLVNDENAHQFLTDPKETFEHQLVIEGIQQSLASLGQISIEKTQLLRLKSICHIMTPIKVKVKERCAFEEIVHLLHPTPALGAFPKNEGMEWLNHYQSQIPRYRFGAPAGFLISETEAKCYVSIRNVQWRNEEKNGSERGPSMFIGAGCGIVAKSKCEKEWAEINLKLKAIKEILAL